MVGMKKKSYYCSLSLDDLYAHYHDGPYQLLFFFSEHYAICQSAVSTRI
jgi:hypothetical protein